MLRKTWVSRNTIVALAAGGMIAGPIVVPAVGSGAPVPFNGSARSAAVPAPPKQPAFQPSIRWRRCPDQDPTEGRALRGLDCGTMEVPMDHERPAGRKITLELTRARHTGPDYQGVALLNRGGPGAHGRDMAALFARSLPEKVAAAYDWIGFDPRGVGASRPALNCGRGYLSPGRARADTVPGTLAEEAAWRDRARAYSRDCAAKNGQLLAHMRTTDWVRDMDMIRVALGRPQISYFGYSYGTYLGARYATMYPDRVRRMVLDSVVRPSRVWYEANLDQNVAFERRIKAFFGWISRNNAAYRLGTTGTAVEQAYYRARSRLAARPLDGKLGPSELDDAYLGAGYSADHWPEQARALSDFVVKGSPGRLRSQWTPLSAMDLNNYAVYTAVQCADAPWPRDWSRWHDDTWRLYKAGNRFETWGNAWYNAPCASWSVRGTARTPVHGSARLPGILLVQGEEDAATPYAGALETHRLLPGSRLLVQDGGGNHGVTLGGDSCVDRTVARYLADGSLPESRPGADAVCQAPPPPPAKGGGNRSGQAGPVQGR